MRTGKLAGVILAALIAAAMMRIPVYAAPAAAGGIQTEEQDETGVSLDYSEIDAALEKLGIEGLPVCVAKTQYSLSDNPALLGKPEGFTLTVRDVRLSAGAGFIVALTGDIMTMPGLPKVPAAYNIDVDADGQISGLF